MVRRRGPSPPVKSLNTLLNDIHKRYVTLTKNDQEHHYRVFIELFRKINDTMKEVDPYYKKYSSMKQIGGSHADQLRVANQSSARVPQEFPDEDVNIVIRLPLNYQIQKNSKNTDIIIEPSPPENAFIKGGFQYLNLPNKKDDWGVNKAAYGWLDKEGYLLRSKFVYWFESVVNKALNRFEQVGTRPCIKVGKTRYTIETSKGGPAVKLYIKNDETGFSLDIDLVPCIRFPKSRWLRQIDSNYLELPKHRNKKYWLMVPKSDKAARSAEERDRSWRVSLNDPECMLLCNKQHLKPTMRLIKKLRTSLGMDDVIKSYHIKSIFFPVIANEDILFWNQSPADLFRFMVYKFYKAIEKCRIPFYWYEDTANNNMIGHINPGILKGYARKLNNLLKILDNPEQFKEVAQYLLNEIEHEEYARSVLGQH